MIDHVALLHFTNVVRSNGSTSDSERIISGVVKLRSQRLHHVVNTWRAWRSGRRSGRCDDESFLSLKFCSNRSVKTECV